MSNPPHSPWRMLTSFSIVVQYSFGQGDNLLGDESKASILRKNISELLLGVKISQHFPWILDALNTLPFFIARHFMPPGALDMRSFSEVCFVMGGCCQEITRPNIA